MFLLNALAQAVIAAFICYLVFPQLFMRDLIVLSMCILCPFFALAFLVIAIRDWRGNATTNLLLRLLDEHTRHKQDQ